MCYSKNESANDQNQDDDRRTKESSDHDPIPLTLHWPGFWEGQDMIISYPHLNQYYTYEPTLTESQYNSFNLNLKWKLMRFNCLGLYVYIALPSFFQQVYIKL